jgi:acetyl esterase/lipase
MPIGYVVTLVLIAGCTVLALAPLTRPRPLGVLSFLAGLVVNEVPQAAFLLLLAATVLAIAQDELLRDPAGWVLLLVAVATAVGLLVLVLRAWRAASIVVAALGDGLGVSAGDGRVEDGWADALRRRELFSLRHKVVPLLMPYPFRPRQVGRVANLSYGDAGRRNLLDVYQHRSKPPGGPVLVYFHGGGYFSGHKHRESRALLHRMAAQGFVCISANYRLRPQADFLDHLVDAKRVIAWAREHGADYGGDTSTLYVSGSSAGAHLASLIALTPHEPAFQPGFEEADTSVAAAICLYGYYGPYYGHSWDERPSSTPMGYDAGRAPAFFVAHGDRDTYVSVEGARRLVAQLRRRSPSPVVYAELPGAQHGFDVLRSVRFQAVVDGVEAFLGQLGRRQR